MAEPVGIEADPDAAAIDALRRTREAVEPVMRTAVDSLPGRMRTIAAYHLGWAEADGRAREVNGLGGSGGSSTSGGSGPSGASGTSGGKLLRPGLVLAAATAVVGAAGVAAALGAANGAGDGEWSTGAGDGEWGTGASNGQWGTGPGNGQRSTGSRGDWATAADPPPGSPPSRPTATRSPGPPGPAALTVAGSGRALLAAAAAVELAHNFTLLHDDVIDRDRTRRHRPTAWTVFGAENAILAGDAMLALALRLVGGEAASRLAECVVEICDGQYEDCAFEDRDDVTLAECLTMAGKKTGALLGCACALGAAAVRADPAAVDAMDGFGREVGLAFQLTDDLLGIWGDPAATGKPVGSDLAARKKSLPVVSALSSGSAAAEELARLYALDRDFTEPELRRAAEAVERAGGRSWAASEATARIANAHAHLRKAPGVNQAAVRDLRAIADLITRRTF